MVCIWGARPSSFSMAEAWVPTVHETSHLWKIFIPTSGRSVPSSGSTSPRKEHFQKWSHTVFLDEPLTGLTFLCTLNQPLQRVSHPSHQEGMPPFPPLGPGGTIPVEPIAMGRHADSGCPQPPWPSGGGRGGQCPSRGSGSSKDWERETFPFQTDTSKVFTTCLQHVG